MEPLAIVEHMLANDAFSQWLGIKVLEIRPGYCLLEMSVRAEMTNGFGLAHGGIAYSLADSALAFASNGHGRKALSVKTAISHLEKVKSGDILQAEAKEMHLGNSLANYYVTISLDGKTVALFEGSVYRTQQNWNLE